MTLLKCVGASDYLACMQRFPSVDNKHMLTHTSAMRYSCERAEKKPGLEYHPIQFLKGTVKATAWGLECAQATYDNGYFELHAGFTNGNLTLKFGSDQLQWPFVSSGLKCVDICVPCSKFKCIRYNDIGKYCFPALYKIQSFSR